MDEMTRQPAMQHIYRGDGSETIRPTHIGELGRGTTRIPSVADTVPVSWIMTRDMICARHDLRLEVLRELMAERRVGCVPIVDERGRPVGMVTKLDLLEQVVARDVGARPARVAGEVMMPLAITLDERATVAHVAAMMAIEDIHHVLIVTGGLLVGLVSTMDIVRWLAANDGLMTD